MYNKYEVPTPGGEVSKLYIRRDTNGRQDKVAKETKILHGIIREELLEGDDGQRKKEALGCSGDRQNYSASCPAGPAGGAARRRHKFGMEPALGREAWP